METSNFIVFRFAHIQWIFLFFHFFFLLVKTSLISISPLFQIVFFFFFLNFAHTHSHIYITHTLTHLIHALFKNTLFVLQQNCISFRWCKKNKKNSLIHSFSIRTESFSVDLHLIVSNSFYRFVQIFWQHFDSHFYFDLFEINDQFT